MNVTSQHGRERVKRVELPGNGWAETFLQRRGQTVEMHMQNQVTNGSGSGSGNYQCCSQIGCFGEKLPNTDECFAHSSQQERAQLLSQLPGTDQVLGLRGTSISQALWDQIAASGMFSGNVLSAPISLAGSEIDATVRLQNVRFAHFLDLTSATIFRHIEFTKSSFEAHVIARHAHFDGGSLNFMGSTFHKEFDLSFSKVDRTSLGFSECIFKRAVSLDGLVGAIHLDKSVFHGNLSCRNARAALMMDSSELHGALDIAQSELQTLRAERLIAHQAIQLGPCAIPYLNLRLSTFSSRVHVDLLSTEIDLTGATMKEGGLILIEKAKIRLDQLSLGGPLRISGKVNSAQQQPEILGMLNADAGQLSLSRVNLTRCSFVGTHGLGTLDIESTVTFARAPIWAGGRRYIADEFAWRSGARTIFQVGWRLDDVIVGSELPKPLPNGTVPVLLSPVVPSQVEGIYRELRRGLESKSDMPSAADFYFGEMEMRRWGGGRSFLEKFFVWCYWILSGYGLRPGRAIAAIVLLVFLGAFWICAYDGSIEQLNFSDATLIAFRAAIPGFKSAENLNSVGQWIETVIRVLGTLFTALFVLATRSIVMRKPNE